jgi:hypothetical protein
LFVDCRRHVSWEGETIKERRRNEMKEERKKYKENCKETRKTKVRK